MNRDNLKKLATYLLSGELKAEFDMEIYDDHKYNQLIRINCGTVGCAAGHGPYAGIPKMQGELWYDYIERCFVDSLTGENRWLFGISWAQTDNTPEGAGLRIEWYLNYGLPEDWYEQMTGLAPLCYYMMA